MTRSVDYTAAVKAVNEAVRLLARKPSGKGDLAEYLSKASLIFSNTFYLPIVFPAYGKNFSLPYISSNKKLAGIGESLEGLTSSHMRERLNADDPWNLISMISFWSITLCIEGLGPASNENLQDEAVYYTSLHGYCDIIMHLPLLLNIPVKFTYATYSPYFFKDALANYLRSSKSFADVGSLIDRGLSMKEFLSRLSPEAWESFRREFTSRISTGYRGFFTTLIFLKWRYDPLDILGLGDEDFIGFDTEQGGVKRMYPVQPTYLGRISAEFLNTYVGTLLPEEALARFYKIIRGYYDCLKKAVSDLKEIPPGSFIHIKDLSSIREYIALLNSLSNEDEYLRNIGIVRPGEIVEDVADYLTNIKAYSIAYGKVFLSKSVFDVISGFDLESLLFEHKLIRTW